MIDINKYIEDKQIKINSEALEHLKNYFFFVSILEKEAKKGEIPVLMISIFGNFINYKIWNIIYRYYPGLEKFDCRLNDDNSKIIIKKEK
jgi:hypothetical protein